MPTGKVAKVFYQGILWESEIFKEVRGTMKMQTKEEEPFRPPESFRVRRVSPYEVHTLDKEGHHCLHPGEAGGIRDPQGGQGHGEEMSVQALLARQVGGAR